MRIAIFSDSFYPEISGISDSIITSAEELAQLGHRINFFVPYYSYKNFEIGGIKSKREIDLDKNIKINRFLSFPFPSGTKQGRMVIPTALRWLDIREFKPDIIHTHLFFGVGLEALFSSKFLKVPLIGTNHTAISEFIRYAPIKADWLKNLSLKYVNWYYSKCNFVSAPSKSVFEEMKKFGFGGRHEVISNPVNTEVFNTFDYFEKETLMLKEKFGLNDKTVVYAGRFAEEKNIDVIIKAVAQAKKAIPDITFALAGHGAAFDSIKKLINKLHLENNIRFLGTIGRYELADLYRASEIFVITSTSETQSMTLIQAMACGLPVIGVRARALPEYIEGNGILIEPGDFKTLSEKIVSLLKNSDLRNELGIRGSKFVQKFSDKSIALKWAEVYQREIADYKNNL